MIPPRNEPVNPDALTQRPGGAPSAAGALPTTAEWPARFRQRFVFCWPLKAFGSTAFTAVFFWGYFFILDNPRSSAFVMPEIWLDRWIALNPVAFPVYISLWVYVFLAPALMGNKRALVHFGWWVGALCLFSLALFWLFPTQTPVHHIDWSLYPGLAIVKGVDAAGNACPSLHVATAVFGACWLHRILRQIQAPAAFRWLSAAQCLAIAWSTMATLQHVALDVMFGAALGLVFAAVSLRRLKGTV